MALEMKQEVQPAKAETQADFSQVLAAAFRAPGTDANGKSTMTATEAGKLGLPPVQLAEVHVGCDDYWACCREGSC